MADSKCPCGSGETFAACCKPYLDNAAEAATPEILMRSRYTAFTRGDFAYLTKTWHPDTVPELGADEPMNWISLEIIETGVDEADEVGEVEFVAKLIVQDRLEVLHEVSEFERLDGRWVYCTGEFKNEGAVPKKVTMKEPCPCGSGEKFKHCHYRG